MSSIIFCDPVIEFNALFDDAVAARLYPLTCASSAKDRQPTSGQSSAYRPRLDVYESKDDNTVTATFELPGLTSEGVAVDVQQNMLTVSGELPAPTSEKEGVVIRERRSGKFSRTLQLPPGIKSEEVKAKMENGILTVTFPRVSAEQEPRRIVIQ